MNPHLNAPLAGERVRELAEQASRARLVRHRRRGLLARLTKQGETS